MKANLYPRLKEINDKPKPFEFYTTPELWGDDYISKKMLEFHLDEKCDLASRNKIFIANSLDWLISKFNINHTTKICDFGCGPGLYTTKFSEKGAAVTGVDLSKRSIDYAKRIASENNLQIDYMVENYLQFITDKKFDLITMIFCDFCVLSKTQRKTMLAKFCEYLTHDGHVIFDVHSLDFFAESNETRSYEYVEKNGFWSNKPHYVFQNNFKYDAEQLVLHKYTIFEEREIKESYNWLQCYSIESIAELLRENGLVVVDYYANVAGDAYQKGAGEIAIVAKKA